MTEDFTTKYKPTILEEYYCDEELKAKIQSYIDSDSRKPLIFYGPAGTGKTTLAQVICNEVGAHMYNVNASMENGVDKIREDVVTWARNTVIGSNGLKMIFFDEADRLTPQAQDALKRTIDDYSKNTIFVFCTNNIHKIIEPLKSRANTTTFQIGYASDDVIRSLLIEVVHKIYSNKAPDVSIDIDAIVKVAHGEPRHAINLLQSYVDGSFTVPDVTTHDRFVEFISKTLSSNYSALEILPLINEDDLNELSSFILEDEMGYIMLRKADKKHNDVLKIIADTDRAMQHSINKDVHLLNMIIRLSEL